MQLSFKINMYRKAAGLSQTQLAKKIGVSKQCVSNWENDNVMPSIEMLVALADIFHVSTDDLLGRSPEKVISVDGLTDEQLAHVRFLVHEFKSLNEKAKKQ